MKNSIIIIVIIIAAGFAFYFFSKRKGMGETPGSNIDPAIEYFEKGKNFLENKEYEEALEQFRLSLEITENPEVRAAYNKTLSALGPM